MPPDVAAPRPLPDPAAAGAWEAGRRTAKELALGKDETGRAIAAVVTCRRTGTVSHTGPLPDTNGRILVKYQYLTGAG